LADSASCQTEVSAITRHFELDFLSNPLDAVAPQPRTNRLSIDIGVAPDGKSETLSVTNVWLKPISSNDLIPAMVGARRYLLSIFLEGRTINPSIFYCFRKPLALKSLPTFSK
jgi:hypothetical protein